MNKALFWRDVSERQKKQRVYEPLREAAVMAIQFGMPVETAVQFLQDEYNRLVLPHTRIPGKLKEEVTV